MYDPRNTLAQQVSEQLQQHFGDKVYRTVIPRNIRLAEAPSHGIPVLAWTGSPKGARVPCACGEMSFPPQSKVDESHGKTTGLGRGLDALLGGDNPSHQKERLARSAGVWLQPGKYQPSSQIDAAAIAELADSIRSQGLMQPIIARPLDGGPLRDHRRRASVAGGAALAGLERCRC
jgi:hypothetical protein